MERSSTSPRRGGYQPPAIPDNIRARLNGTRSDRNVGDDAHIVPPGLDNIRAPMNGKNVNFPRPIQRTARFRYVAGGW